MNFRNTALIKLLGVKVNMISLNGLLNNIVALINSDKKAVIEYINVHALNISYNYRWFRDFLNNSDITFCDGFGVKLAALLTNQELPYRYTPPDFIDCVGRISSENCWKIFFLGAKPGVSKRAAETFMEKYPDLKIESYHGYFDKTKMSNENQNIIKLINDFRPQILVLGFGMPLQEKWISENLDDLEINIAFPAGALFDYMSGEIDRAPQWITQYGFEWLGRLIIEPRRLWRRYIIGNPLFFWRILKHHILQIPFSE